jgi:hypothetical protein
MSGDGPHQEPDNATPLGADEREALIPSHVALRGELKRTRTAEHPRGRQLGLRTSQESTG